MSLETSTAVWSDFVQVVVLVLAGAILWLELWRMKRRNGREITEPLLMIIWMVHTIVFYVAVLLEDINILNLTNEGSFFTSWSASLRLHGYTSLLVITYLRVHRRRLIKRATEGILNGSINTDK